MLASFYKEQLWYREQLLPCKPMCAWPGRIQGRCIDVELPLNAEFKGQWCLLPCGLHQLLSNKQVPISLSGDLGGQQVFLVLNPERELVSLGTVF